MLSKVKNFKIWGRCPETKSNMVTVFIDSFSSERNFAGDHDCKNVKTTCGSQISLYLGVLGKVRAIPTMNWWTSSSWPTFFPSIFTYVLRAALAVERPEIPNFKFCKKSSSSVTSGLRESIPFCKQCISHWAM